MALSYRSTPNPDIIPHIYTIPGLYRTALHLHLMAPCSIPPLLHFTLQYLTPTELCLIIQYPERHLSWHNPNVSILCQYITSLGTTQTFEEAK